MTGTEKPTIPIEARAKGRRTLLLLALVVITPVIASYSAYYFFPREQRTNYGELLATPAPALAGTRADGLPFALAQLKGKWVLAAGAPGACDASCAGALHATRQARTIQGREMERVQRVWLVTDAQPLDTLVMREFDGTSMLRVNGDALKAWLPVEAGGKTSDHLYLIDPLGNLMMRFPKDADPNKIKKDIAKLLKASAIG